MTQHYYLLDTLVIVSTRTAIFFVSTCSEKNIIAKLSHVNKNKGVADWGPLTERRSYGTKFGTTYVPLVQNCSSFSSHYFVSLSLTVRMATFSIFLSFCLASQSLFPSC